MKKWTYAKLGDMSDIGRGSSPRPINDNAYFINGAIPWIKIADATASHKYIYSTKEHVNEYGASFSRKLAPGSLIVAASGTLGFPIFLGVEGCVHDGWLYFKSISKKLDNQYLYYCLQTYVPSFNAVSYGAAIQNINTDILRNTLIPTPPPKTQRKIAAILSAYDDLIEVNERRIALLERMAEELYREWFVRMRFPGHQEYDGSLPSGWKYRKIADSFEICGGGTPSTDMPSYWHNGTINWYSPTDLTSSDSVFSFASKTKITELGLKESSASLFPAYSIMLTSRATIGKVSINTTPACTNQGFINCLPNECFSLHYLYFWLKANKDLFILHANGSTFLEITKGKFKELSILSPDKHVIDKYEELVAPIFDQLQKLQIAIRNLSATRDRLLSRLMSGALDVDDLDIAFPPSMEEELAISKG